MCGFCFTVCPCAEKRLGLFCQANLLSLYRQSRLWGSAKAKYESLTSTALKKRKEHDSISTFQCRAAISYHAAIWWFWYCRILYQINVGRKEKKTWASVAGVGWDSITCSHQSKKQKKKANWIGSSKPNIWTAVCNLSGHQPIYLLIWNLEFQEQDITLARLL